MNRKRRPAIGVVLEISTPAGLAYAQWSHESQDYGELIRVLPGLFGVSPASICDLCATPELYFAFYPVRLALKEQLVRVVADCPIPSWAEELPIMRTAGLGVYDGSNPQDWYLWGGKASTRLERMDAHHYDLSVTGIWNHQLLVERIASGWSPRDDLGPLHSTGTGEDQSEASDRRSASTTHYLYFDNEELAQKAADGLADRKCDVELQKSAGSDQWLVLVRDESDPDALRTELEAFAKTYHGEYDGWEFARDGFR